MTCGGRVYKGDELEFTLPFNVSGASNIVVSFYTDGEYSIEKSVEAEDGKIVTEIAKTDLDLLSDGVIRYTITYDLDGEEHSITSNTPNYLRTPAGYSAITYDDIYQSGYTAGQEDCPECSGSTECRIQTKIFSVSDINMENVFPDEGYDGMSQVMLLTHDVYDSGYTDGYQSGYTAGQADCPECSGSSDCSCSIRERDCTHGIGFMGPARFMISEDNEEWDIHDVTTKLGYYIKKLYIPEEDIEYYFEASDFKDSFSFEFGEGYHSVWFELDNDLPRYDWIKIKNGGTDVFIDLIIASYAYDWNDIAPDNVIDNEYNLVKQSRSTEENIMRILYLY